MQFDVIIGNPPYQDGSVSIYPDFVQMGMANGTLVAMITKNGWLASPGLSVVRDRMLDFGLQEIKNYTVRGEVFPEIRVSVTSFLLNSKFSGETSYKEIRNDKVINEYTAELGELHYIPGSSLEDSIVSKVRSFNEVAFGGKVISSTCFGIGTNGKLPNNEKIKEQTIKSEAYDTELVYMVDSNNDRRVYVKHGDIVKNSNLIEQYKVVCGEKLNMNHAVVSNVKMFGPGVIFTHSYTLLYNTYDKVEAENVSKYARTRFFRYLTSLLVDNMSSTNEQRFKLVPEQCYKDNSEIDWGGTLEEIDSQLFYKYGLESEEVKHIKEKVYQYKEG